MLKIMVGRFRSLADNVECMRSGGLFIRVSILKRNKMQELKQIKLTDAVGKKIAGVKVGYEKHIIKYEDGTFTFFERWEEWGCPGQGDVTLKYEKFIEKLGIRSDGSTYFTGTQEMLIELGILDGQKLVQDAKERIEKYVEECKARERKEYEKLKAKFEIGDGQ